MDRILVEEMMDHHMEEAMVTRKTGVITIVPFYQLFLTMVAP